MDSASLAWLSSASPSTASGEKWEETSVKGDGEISARSEHPEVLLQPAECADEHHSLGGRTDFRNCAACLAKSLRLSGAMVSCA